MYYIVKYYMRYFLIWYIVAYDEENMFIVFGAVVTQGTER